MKKTLSVDKLLPKRRPKSTIQDLFKAHGINKWYFLTCFSEILIASHTLSFKKTYLKISSAKLLPFLQGRWVKHRGKMVAISETAYLHTGGGEVRLVLKRLNLLCQICAVNIFIEPCNIIISCLSFITRVYGIFKYNDIKIRQINAPTKYICWLITRLISLLQCTHWVIIGTHMLPWEIDHFKN